MIFCQNNLITSSNATITGGDANYPIGYLIDDFANTSCLFTDIVIDLGAATAIDTLGIISPNNTLTIQANSADSWATPPFYIYMDKINSTDVSLELISQTYRYWRIIETGSVNFIDYATGTDVNLTSPDGNYNTPSNLCFMVDDIGDCGISVGNNQWGSSSLGATSFSSFASSGTYGQVKFYPFSGTTWTSFQGSGSDGEVIFNLPQLANGDSLGGYFKFYFSSANVTAAFTGNGEDCIIAQNGSMYKTSISPSNLVTRWDGVAGPAAPDNIATGNPIFCPHAYIGNRLVFPDPLYGSTPQRQKTDIINSTPSGQRFTTQGVTIKEQDFNIRFATDTQYATLKTFQESSYRASAGIFAQTELNFDLFDPYFAIINLEENTHERPGRHSYNLEVQEAK
jgi:hypothetical protein